MLDFLKNEQIVNTCVIILLMAIVVMTFINFSQINNNKQENYCGCNMPAKQLEIDNNIHNDVKQNDTLDNDSITDNYVANNQTIEIEDGNKLILYYALWCGFSRQFLPIWEQVKTVIKSTPELNTSCVEYDCEAQKQMCQAVDGFPSIILIKKDGTKIKYNGQRSIESLLEFVNSNK